ncbi:MAG: topoisomerase DNA-binding C4 zinc finger domain-containing protein [Haemophilus parahaemolyticus]|nr:topoisomerase DNA-binding C4 zinc finger domain-containing protein [Haemophilus parahaemolyticus]
MSLFKSTKQEEHCPECGALLQIKQGKYGLFLGCSRYPDCSYIRPLHQSSHVIKTLDEICPECGHFLQIKQGQNGMFIGCSNYPECHFIVQEEQEKPEESWLCPECNKHHLVPRKGRTGKIFYGCEGYPKCRFTLAAKPIEKECPACHFSLAVLRKGKKGYQCANKACQHIFEERETEQAVKKDE